MDDLDFIDDVCPNPSELLDIIAYKRPTGGPEARLVLAVIQSAAKIGDTKYFLGDTFKRHCNLVGLDCEVILSEIKRKALIKGSSACNYVRGCPKVIADIKERRYVKGQTLVKIGCDYGLDYNTVRKILKRNS